VCKSYQEDFHAFATLSLNPEELQLSVKKHLEIDWNPHLVDDVFARQAVFIGIYDGQVLVTAMHQLASFITSHGGSGVSQYLRQELHGLFESVDKSEIPELYEWMRELGGYFKRFKGGALAPWIHGGETPGLDLEARCTQAFLEVSSYLLSRHRRKPACARLTDTSPSIRWPRNVALPHRSLFSIP
jgi:protein phosphatase PTC6